MGDNSKIQWTTHSWSPWEGCAKVGPGCDNCYAWRRNERFSDGENWGKGAPRRLTSEAGWKKPLAWQRAAAKSGEIVRVFPSICDPFDAEVDDAWRWRLFDLIYATPALTWLLLTKRPGYAHLYMHEEFRRGREADQPMPFNVWIGTSIENRQTAAVRISQLRKVGAKYRFLSVEPLLEDIGALDLRGIDWVIVGGESGPGARPCHVDWIRAVVAQCRAAFVPVFVKQLGAKPRFDVRDDETISGARHRRLNDKKGGDIEEFPMDLRVRQFPEGVV